MTLSFLRSRLALVAVCALVVACGGGGDAEEDGADADANAEVTEDDFIDEFHGVCEDLQDDLLGFRADFGDLDDDDVEGLVELLEGSQEIYADAIDELGEVEAPEDIQADVDELLEVMEERADISSELVEALEDDDGSAFDDAVDEAAELDDEIEERNEELDLECYVADDRSDDLSDDLSDSSGDFSDDLSESSDDFSDSGGELEELGEPQSPGEVIPEYGTVDRDARFDGLADSCFDGDLNDCDRLYSLTPVSESIFSYEGYGATCGGRLDQEAPGTCAARG